MPSRHYEAIALGRLPRIPEPFGDTAEFERGASGTEPGAGCGYVTVSNSIFASPGTAMYRFFVAPSAPGAAAREPADREIHGIRADARRGGRPCRGPLPHRYFAALSEASYSSHPLPLLVQVVGELNCTRTSSSPVALAKRPVPPVIT